MIHRGDGSEATTPISPRDNEIRIAQKTKEENLVKETIILQKVNKVQRLAFKDRFPGQIEHCMRLTTERLQAILSNKPVDLSKPETWDCTAKEIHDLSHGLYYLTIISQHYPYEGE